MTTDAQKLSRRAILSDEERTMLAIAMTEQMQQPFSRVSAETGLDAELLRKLVRDGVLEGTAPYRVRDVVGTCDIERAREVSEKLHRARNLVDGMPILATDAALKYKFSRATIYHWRKQGWIKEMDTAPNGDLLFNEGDIAFARALANLSGHLAGKPVFPPRKRK
jgi:hypothetical protein